MYIGTPSVKVAIVAIVSIIGIGALLYYTYTEQRKSVPSTKSLQTFLAGASKSLAEIDTDKDGLKDWEESLWNTDPKNADSDNDGTKDGDETDRNRDPAKKGEDAFTPEATLAVPDYFKTSTSTTEATGKALFARYLALKQSGKFSAVTQQSLIDDLTNNILSSSSVAPKYRKTDLTVVPTNAENASLYKFNMQAVSTFVSESGLRGSELLAIALAVNGNPENIAKGMESLDPFITVHEKALQKFETIPVPEVVADAHVTFLSTYAAYVETLRMIRDAAADPIQGMVASSTYMQREQQMQRAYLVLKNYMSSTPS